MTWWSVIGVCTLVRVFSLTTLHLTSNSTHTHTHAHAQRLLLIVVVLMIVTGLFLFTYEQTAFNVEGFVLVMSASIITGLRWTTAQLTIQKEELGGCGLGVAKFAENLQLQQNEKVVLFC